MAKSLVYFGFFNPENTTNSKKSRIENFVSLLEKKLSLKPGEADMVAMQHIFKIEHKDGKTTTRKSTLIMIGDKHGKSAMSVTVGTPTAIASQVKLKILCTS